MLSFKENTETRGNRKKSGSARSQMNWFIQKKKTLFFGRSNEKDEKIGFCVLKIQSVRDLVVLKIYL
jgi:hypothetical protein